MKINKFYLYFTILLMVLLPIISVIVDSYIYKSSMNLIPLIGKWFVFWAVGLRLFTAGLRQIINPDFTAKTILHINGKECYVVIMELGFANFCMGLSAIISLFIPPWRLAVAFTYKWIIFRNCRAEPCT